MRYRSAILFAAFCWPMAGSVMTYTNFGAWAQAAGEQPNVILETETFDGNQSHTPGLAISTRSGMGGVVEPGNGTISGDEWSDCVGTNACNGLLYDTTSFSMSKPLFGFGGTWNLLAAYPGGLELYIDDSPQAISPNQYFDGHTLEGGAYSGFFGFVSDTPFTSVLFASSVGSQAFTLSDAVLSVDPPAPAPEPAGLALAGGIVLLAGVLRRKATNQRNTAKSGARKLCKCPLSTPRRCGTSSAFGLRS